MQSPVIHNKNKIWWPDIEFKRKSLLSKMFTKAMLAVHFIYWPFCLLHTGT